MHLFGLLILLVISTNSYGDISKLRVYPSGIRVSFEAPEKIEEAPVVASRKNRRPFRWKKETQADPIEETTEKKMISYQRFVRLINALDLENTHHLSLAFYDEKKQLISKEIVTNTSEPSPNYIFYMDRNTGRHFKGYLDIYHIPSTASYFKVGIFDNKNELTGEVQHPDFETGNIVSISKYQQISPKQKIMVQIEILGNKNNPTTRLGAFYFTR